MTMLSNIAIGLVLILVVIAIAFVTYGRENTWTLVAGPPDMGIYDFTAMPRSSTANDVLACTEGLCDGKADFVLPALDATPGEAISRLDSTLEGAPRVRRVDDGSDPDYARYVTWSPTMRFPDTTDIRAVALEGGKSGLKVYARALVGQRDFDANTARIREWIAKISP